MEEETSTSQDHGDRLRVENEFKEERHIPLKRLNTLPEGLENDAYEENEETDKTLPVGTLDNTEDRMKTRDSSLDIKDNNPHPIGSSLPKYTTEDLTSRRFRGKQRGTLDVWWLFDDGGE